jgi:cytochrome c peroxidase
MKNFLLKFRMSFLVLLVGFAVMLFAVISCNKTTYSYSEGIKPIPGAVAPALPATAYNYQNTNGASNDLITLGRVLFYDKNLSANNMVACGSCHQQANGFADNKSFSIGTGGSTLRNAHSLVNTNNSKFWDGKLGSGCAGIANSGSSNNNNNNSNNNNSNGYSGGGQQVTPVASVPIQSPIELNMPDGNALSTKLSSLYYYPYLFQLAFPASEGFSGNQITIENIETALGSYIGTIMANNSTYDQAYPANGTPGTVTLSQIEQDGMNLFNGRGMCANCHVPANSFGGNANQFEDIGLDLVYKDLGRGAITGSQDNGKFHVPSLKNVALSAPYMHDGRYTTLAQVVDFFSDSIHSSPNLSSAFTANPTSNGNGSFTASSNYGNYGPAVPLGLTAYQKSSLVAFLQTLTDNSLVTDVRYSNPFKQ